MKDALRAYVGAVTERLVAADRGESLAERGTRFADANLSNSG
jgi:hypothetical protein